MYILFIFLILIILTMGFYIYNIREELNKKVQTDSKIQQENIELEKKKAILINEYELIKQEINKHNEDLYAIQSKIKNMENISKDAFSDYCDLLEKDYKYKEKEYDEYIQNLKLSYDTIQEKTNGEIEQIEYELEKLKNTRAAALEAIRKEKEVKENKSFYCLKVNEIELIDIKTLSKIKTQLNQPRILSMLIWSTYFQKPMTKLCNDILGVNTKMGIYKITNQLDDCCYIGQAVDIAKRWKDHAKCGLGIDTPASNKLYKAMLEDGIWNFSWELLEECRREELNEKEKFYIELYKSYEYGYNSNTGISKS